MTQPHLSSALDEETARAELYGLISELFYAPARPELLEQLRVAATEAPAAGGFLEEPWRQLVGVAREMDDRSIQNEHDALFGGVGKPEVYAFASHFLTGFLNEKPLAQMRTDLAALGLGRDETTMSETEDHVSYVFEVMRFLVAGEDVAVSNLTQQAKFFAAHVQTWLPAFCDAVQATPRARFYAALAELTRAFVNVEAQGFDMLA
ncbi:molecular chaperone TorD family protein [Rhodoferax sp. OV413]|uniref:TorD/DmsD family molecular chaperone n=1 Tax=Rhodoferax sp. OV413 TaxID=1855285 RepID=UPI0025D630DB|nr:molecular chaperone TorD family protein [Rhodoferax sp. OV413]